MSQHSPNSSFAELTIYLLNFQQNKGKRKQFKILNYAEFLIMISHSAKITNGPKRIS